MRPIREKTFVKTIARCKSDRISNCGRSAGSRRGICETDYENHRANIVAGEYTWDDVEAAGLCLPVQRHVREDMKEIIRRQNAGKTA